MFAIGWHGGLALVFASPLEMRTVASALTGFAEAIESGKLSETAPWIYHLHDRDPGVTTKELAALKEALSRGQAFLTLSKIGGPDGEAGTAAGTDGPSAGEGRP